MLFNYAYFLGILKEQGIRIEVAITAVPRDRNVTPQEESPKEVERVVGGLQTVTILCGDSSVSDADASKM